MMILIMEIGFNENQFVNYEQKRILKRSNHMDFTILAVVKRDIPMLVLFLL